jgi:hypothetical protein
MSLKPGSSQHMAYYQKFAAASYSTDSEVRQSTVPMGFKLDTELSNRNRAVYYNPDTFKLYFPNEEQSLKERPPYQTLLTDAALALGFGENTTRFRNAAKLAKSVQEKYEGWTFESTSHSLGGSSIAKHLHDTMDFRSTVFSAHLPTTQILQQAMQTKLNNSRGNDTLHAYTVAHDPVGAGLYLAGSAFAVKQRVQNPHALDNFKAPQASNSSSSAT